MTDKLSTQDDEIVKRLKNLRGAGVNYPADSLKKRRTSFQNETKGLVLAAPLAFLAKGRFQFLANVTEKGLETILVSLLVVSASLSAYLFRDEIKGLLIPGTGRVRDELLVPPKGDPQWGKAVLDALLEERREGR